MAQRKIRIPIPPDLAAETLFRSDRTCCVCRIANKQVQIHHINDDPSDNRSANLAVLCLECHAQTQMSGGFGRKLNAEVVTLYRDHWLTSVEMRRAGDSLKSELDPAHVTTSSARSAASSDATKLESSVRLVAEKFRVQTQRMSQLTDATNSLADISREYTGAMRRATLKTQVATSQAERTGAMEELANELVQIVPRFSTQAYATGRLQNEMNREYRGILAIIKGIPKEQWRNSLTRALKAMKRDAESRLEMIDKLREANEGTSGIWGKSPRLDRTLQHMEEARQQIIDGRDNYLNLLKELDSIGA